MHGRNLKITLHCLIPDKKVTMFLSQHPLNLWTMNVDSQKEPEAMGVPIFFQYYKNGNNNSRVKTPLLSV